MLRQRRWISALSAGLLWACSAPTIDGSNSESAKASIDEIARELPPADRERFEAAVHLLVIDALSHASSEGLEIGTITQRADARMIASLDGQTADEIIARADAILATGETPGGS